MPFSFSPRVKWLLLTTCCLVLAPGAATYAQTSKATPTARQVYTPADFARFAPRSALDMVRQVPGFVLREGGSERGFGQADTNVLINGRRISGKSNGPVQALGRITAASVEQLVVLDGASLDLGGLSGQVLNVVISDETQLSGRFQVRPAHRTEQSRWQTREFDVSLTGNSADTNWTVRVANAQGLYAASGFEEVRDSDGVLTDLRHEKRKDSSDEPNLSGSLSHITAGGSVLNLTGELNGFDDEVREISERESGSPNSNRRILIEQEDGRDYELGADYEFNAAGGSAETHRTAPI